MGRGLESGGRQGMRRLAGLAIAAIATAAVWAAPALGGNYLVNTAADSTDASACASAAAGCSLRGAILAANAAGGSSTITVPARSTAPA